jgi:glucose-6-phosphate-specific signal transduction histidine kinase
VKGILVLAGFVAGAAGVVMSLGHYGWYTGMLAAHANASAIQISQIANQATVMLLTDVCFLLAVIAVGVFIGAAKE